MQTKGEQLELALAAFRREQGQSYLRSLPEPGAPRGVLRARNFLCSEAGLVLVDDAFSSGELTPAIQAATMAQLARAHAERAYSEARSQSAGLADLIVRVDPQERSVGAIWADFRRDRSASQRARSAAALEPLLAEHAVQLVAARARADHAAATLLARFTAPRHPDAGPEGGVAPVAEDWLTRTQELAGEAFQVARKTSEVEGGSALDTLWAVLGGQYYGLFPRPGRYRRLATELEPFGLRRQLARAARLAPEHSDLFGATHVCPVAVPHDVRVAPARVELGLASELSAADALGRAAAHAHASPALPFALRHASAGTVARALGSVSVLRFVEPLFLRKRRELNMREAGELARRSAAFVLLETRLLAAALLARGLVGPDAQGRAHALAERALLGPIAPGTALFLLTRLSASSAFRGKVWGSGLVFALRERFDEDWYANPHAGEPLRGAAARAGDFSVEALAAELGARIEDGPRKLSELF
jgi:hypothetical protein